MSNQAVDVEILGKTTRVNCPSGQEASLIRAAQDLDQRLKDMAERTKVTNEVKLLTIAALNICYELQTERQKQNDQQQQISERVEELTASLQAVLNKVPHG
ncbi:cell division protein ZapA [Vibrio metschnikovii]|nr:cell division protein ZapA [Vibrio metschnikovii]